MFNLTGRKQVKHATLNWNYYQKITHVDHCPPQIRLEVYRASSCNVALGHMKDSIAALESAIYLKNTRQKDEDSNSCKSSSS
jgi:hypothetical protein